MISKIMKVYFFKTLKILILILFVSCKHNSDCDFDIIDLKCEYAANPLAINTNKPSFSWRLSSSKRNIYQRAYQILVASSYELLNKDSFDCWNSGKINSSRSINIVYSGKTLKSNTDYYWKVKVWLNKSCYKTSEIAKFGIGITKNNEWKARWIGYDKPFPWDKENTHSQLSARYLRKKFNIDSTDNIIKAKIFISGLGLYQLYFNEENLTKDLLVPAPTDYNKNVLYNVYDVTDIIKKNNIVAVILGNGRYYTMRQNYKPYKIKNFGYPKLLFQLELTYSNGKKQYIVSDTDWKIFADGPIRSNNEYDGEIYDARKEMKNWYKLDFDDSKWFNAEYVSNPEGILMAQVNEPVGIIDSIKPINIKKIRNGYLIDFGQNFAGFINLKLKNAVKGDSIKIKFAEIIDSSGNIITENLRDAFSTDVYICKGDTLEYFKPTFVYHGFRYAEITGQKKAPNLKEVKAYVIADKFDVIGYFETSNDLINKIYHNAYWSILSNYKGIPVDCPQRNERQPWLGDRTIVSLGENYIFDNNKFYIKWLDDIMFSQNYYGSIPDVAPAFWRYYTDNVTWPAVYFFLVDMFYTRYQDEQLVRKHYPFMKKWVDYMIDNYMNNYIIERDKYGDWCVPPLNRKEIHTKDSTRVTDGRLIATTYFYQILQLMKKFASITKNNHDKNRFANISLKIKNSFNECFYNPNTGYYSNNSTTANLLPLAFKMVQENESRKVYNSFINNVEKINNGQISTGVVGTQWIMRTLTEYGRPDLAFKLLNNRNYPGWGYMVEKGATTMWELWNGDVAPYSMNSHNHVMLIGDLIIWLYENLAGIKPSQNKGFREIIMHPWLAPELSYVKASYNSIYGKFKSEWRFENNVYYWNIEIPPNTKALVYFPVRKDRFLMESGRHVSKIKGIRYLGRHQGCLVMEVGSGDYKFSWIK